MWGLDSRIYGIWGYRLSEYQGNRWLKETIGPNWHNRWRPFSGPEGSRNLNFPDFMTTAQDSVKVVSLTHRPPLPPGNAPGTHFILRIILWPISVSWGMGLRPIACWDCGFESHRSHGYVCVECCVLSGRGLCDELITRPVESYWPWYVFVCDLETLWMRKPWPALGRSATRGEYIYIYNIM